MKKFPVILRLRGEHFFSTEGKGKLRLTVNGRLSETSNRAGELRIAVGSHRSWVFARVSGCEMSLCDYGEGPGSLWETLRPFFCLMERTQAQDCNERQGEKAAGHTCNFIPFSRSVTVTDVLDFFLR